MTLTLKARLRSRIRRIRSLPEVADHDCEVYGIWIRRDGGQLECRVCGRP